MRAIVLIEDDMQFWEFITYTLENEGYVVIPAAIGAYRQFDRALHEQQGVGLGLQIARRLTELLGGTFALESREGIGSRATIALPLAATPADAPSIAASA